MYLEVVEYDNFIEIDSKHLADVDDYDHYISVVNSSYDMFNNDFLKAFNTKNAVGFFGLNDVLPIDLPIGLFKKQLSGARSATTVNLDFYTNSFKNMFLRMDVNGDEVEWFNYISENKLINFKQILIVLDPTVNETALKKLNNTHVIVNIETKNDKHVITYLRKDALTDYKPTRKIGKFVGLSGSPPWRKIEETVEPTPVVEEPIVEEPVIVEETVVEETVVEEPVVEEPVVEEPVVEETVVEEPVVEETVVEEPVVEETVVEEPVVPVVEEPVVEETVVEETVVEEPVQETVVEEPVVEEPIIVTIYEEPVSEESVPLVENDNIVLVSEEAIVEESVVEEATVEESIVLVSEEPVVEETVAVDEETEYTDEVISDDSCEEQQTTTEEQTTAPKKRGRPRKQK